MARRTGAGGAGAADTTVEPERGVIVQAGVHPSAAIEPIEYEVVRSARRRRTLQLTVDAHGVRVRAPLRTPLREIEAFVRERAPWIARHRPVATPPLAYVTGEVIPFEGRALPLFVSARRTRSATVTRGLFDLSITAPARYEGARRIRAIERAVTRWYAERARAAIEASVGRWTAITGLVPRRVLIRNQHQRWGSCSPDGTLRFNWRLVMLAPEFLDYVVVHELVHLAVPNHGSGFWSAVAGLLPDHAARRRRVREAAASLPAL